MSKTWIEDDVPAFPGNELVNQAGGSEYLPSVAGMSLRDYFAAKAMQSLIEGTSLQNCDGGAAKTTA